MDRPLTCLYVLNALPGLPRSGGLGLNEVRYTAAMPADIDPILSARGLSWADIQAQTVTRRGGRYTRLLGPDGTPL